jgi:hypothetical protein
VYVAHSLSAETAWSAPFIPAVPDTTVSADDISSIVQMHGAIGIMWSNELSGSFDFAMHGDAAPDDQWTEETPDQGTLRADDHINLRTVVAGSDGRVFAAVKTSLNDDPSNPPDSPYIEVLIRSGTNDWRVVPVTEIKDDTTRPVLSIDPDSGTLYVFFTVGSGANSGTIHYKTTPLSNVQFDPTTTGDVFLNWPGANINNASTSKDPIGEATGAFVLASDEDSGTYYHAELSLAAASPPDVEKPTTPQGLHATATSSNSVALTWTAASDNVGVTGYDVYRDGTQIGTTASPGYTDITAQPQTTYTYTVDAYDAAGNVSASSGPASATTPASGGSTGSFHGATHSAASGNSLLLAKPSTAQPGDLLLAGVTVNGWPSITGPTGWKLVRMDAQKTKIRQAVYSHVVTATDASSYTWKFKTAQPSAGSMVAYAGVSAATPVDAASGQTAAAKTSVTAPSVTTGAAAELVVAFFGTTAATTFTPPPGTTERTDVATGPGSAAVTAEACDFVATPAGATGAKNATAGLAAVNAGQLVALRSS